MPGILDAMTVWNWVGMAATIAAYCVAGYRLGRKAST